MFDRVVDMPQPYLLKLLKNGSDSLMYLNFQARSWIFLVTYCEKHSNNGAVRKLRFCDAIRNSPSFDIMYLYTVAQA